ncbi:MAG: ABC transporter permease [Clostridia bacterium]|nr:ABC transporter permease [Clostridia bacterium]MBR2954521.1 ABC transporter permease [Clostridia bacterium]
MNIRENIRIAVFSIKTNLMRSLLTMLGIIIGVASVIAIVTVGNGGRDYIVGMIRDMGNSAISLTVNTNYADDDDYFTDADITAIKKIDGVQYASMQSISMCQMTANDMTGILMGIGCNTDMAMLMRTPLLYGRFFTEEEYIEGKNVGVIDVGSALQLFGRKDVVGESVSCTSNDLTLSVRIVGVVDIMASMNLDTEEMMSSMGSMMGGMQMTSCMLLMPAPVTATLNGRTSGRYDMLQITAVDENMLDEIGTAALNYVHSLHDNYEKECYTVTNMATYIDLLDTVINVFTIFIAAVSAISLVVGGIGVMNIMLVSITERTREIGIRKALGAKTGTIMFQFLTESIILCLIGGVIGLLLGVAAAAFVSYIMNVPLFVEPATVLLAVGFSSAIGIIFGVYPAKRAANLPPIEALRRD